MSLDLTIQNLPSNWIPIGDLGCCVQMFHRWKRIVQTNKNPNSVGCRDDLRRIRDRKKFRVSKMKTLDILNIEPIAQIECHQSVTRADFEPSPFFLHSSSSYFSGRPSSHSRNNIHVDIIRTRTSWLRGSRDTRTDEPADPCQVLQSRQITASMPPDREYVIRSSHSDFSQAEDASEFQPFAFLSRSREVSSCELIPELILSSCFCSIFALKLGVSAR